MEGIGLAIVGATGAVGRTVLGILEEENIDISIRELRLFASKKSAGKQVVFKGQEYTVEEMDPSKFKDIEVAIFSAGSDVSKSMGEEVAKQGTVVIDNSSAFRMKDEVPLVTAGVNDEAARNHQGIIANPNCSTIQMVCALKPIYDQVGIKRVVVSTYQSVSGTGYDAMEELKAQSLDYLNDKAFQPEVYPHQIAFNMLPHLDVFDDEGNTKEELKMVNETKKIFNDDSIGVSATTVRVPVFVGHSEAVNIETKEHISRKEVMDLLQRTPEIVVLDDPMNNKYPMPVDVAGKNEVFVGRIREDKSISNGINMWVVADNLRKGAAYNAIKIVEYTTKNGMLGCISKITLFIWISLFFYVERFTEEITKIYAAEIINVLEHIHKNNIMHRDLKPENVLITQDYHLKIVSITSLAYNSIWILIR